MSGISAEDVQRELLNDPVNAEKAAAYAALVRALQAVRVAADRVFTLKPNEPDSVDCWEKSDPEVAELREALAAVALIEKGPSNG